MNKRPLQTYLQWTIGLTLALNLLFIFKDVSDDIAEGAGAQHIVPELLVIVGTLVTAILALVSVIQLRNKTESLTNEVNVLRHVNQNWQNRTKVYAEGLSLEIDRQLALWNLSEAEKEIALLLLKGLSNKEIAEVRETSEHTIKQQSSSIYRKSGLSTRSELSAFFLEDLLTPHMDKLKPDFHPSNSSHESPTNEVSSK